MAKQLTSYLPLTLGALALLVLFLVVAHLQTQPNSGQLILPTPNAVGSAFS